MKRGGIATRAASARDNEAAASAVAPASGEALFGTGKASFADVLRELRPLFPCPLLDGEGYTRLLERAAELPAAAAAFFGFEFRLGDPDPAADLCVPVASDVADAATRELPVAGVFIREARSGAGLQPSRAALAQCIDGFGRSDSTLAGWAEGVLLKYDIVGSGGQPGTPGIHFAVRREPGPAGHDVQDSARRNIARTLANACCRTADAAEQRAVERAMDALPPGARVGQAGAMPDRAERAIRLLVHGIDRAEAPAFLTRLGWPGPVAFAARILADLGVDSSFALSFDVTARGAGPRLGLEVHAKAGRGWQHTTRGDWRPWVARLAEKGWCTAAKAQGMLDWPGHRKTYADNGVFLAHQGINHLKITVTGGAVEAKGCVGMSLVPLGTAA